FGLVAVIRSARVARELGSSRADRRLPGGSGGRAVGAPHGRLVWSPTRARKDGIARSLTPVQEAGAPRRPPWLKTTRKCEMLKKTVICSSALALFVSHAHAQTEASESVALRADSDGAVATGYNERYKPMANTCELGFFAGLLFPS